MVILVLVELVLVQIDGVVNVLYVCHLLEVLFVSKFEVLDFVCVGIRESVVLYCNGDVAVVRKVVVMAYFEGFELVEVPFNNVDLKQMCVIEIVMMDYCCLLDGLADLVSVEVEVENLVLLFDQVD